MRPAMRGSEKYKVGEPWEDLLLFYEYFNGETGHGLGAKHQTGWTALVATLLRDRVRSARG